MQLTTATIGGLRRVLRTFRDIPVHETAVFMALADEHNYVSVAGTVPLHLLSCASYDKHMEYLRVLPHAAVPFLRAQVTENTRGSAIVQTSVTACAPIALDEPLLFPSDVGRIQYHMETRVKPVNRSEIGRHLARSFRTLIHRCDLALTALPDIPSFNRIMLREIYHGTTLSAPCLYNFLVYTDNKEYNDIMRALSNWRRTCERIEITPELYEKVTAIAYGTGPAEVRLTAAVKAVGFKF